MKKAILGAAILTVTATAAQAQQKYDRTLEAAAIEIVAAKMGELRGSFSSDQKLVLVEPIDPHRPTHLGGDREYLAYAELTASLTRSF